MTKTDDKLISVIVPCYNVDEYVERCLKSICNQTYRNLEILLINDGSTDNTLSIIENIAKKDPRIRIVSQNNRGLAAARQRGVEESSGEYITFVDSDDYVTSDYVEFMYQLLAQHDFVAKMSLCSLENVVEATGKHINNGNSQITRLSGKECIESMLYGGLVDTCAYAKLVKRELYFSDAFPGFPIGYQFEDIATSYALFEQCPVVECGFVAKYYYYLRAKSITSSAFTPSKLDLVKMTDKMASAVLEEYPDLHSAVIRRQVYASFSTLNQTLGYRQAKKYQPELVAFIKKHRLEVLSNPKTPRRDRMAYKMLSLGLPCYRIAWNLYLKLIAKKK